MLLSLVFTFGCSDMPDNRTGRSVTVSILPLKYFVDRISDSSIGVTVLVPPGVSPETYEPAMSQLIAASKGSLFFGISILGFEQGWQEQLSSLGNDTKYIDVSGNMELISGTHGHHDEDHHGHDPHIWLAPVNARIIAENIFKALCVKWPGDTALFNRNYLDLIKEINETEEYIKFNINNLPNKKFLIYHPALAYYAHQFGLIQIALEQDGKNPSPAYLKDLFDKVAAENMNHILVQVEIPADRVAPLAEQIKAEIVHFDPLMYNWKENMLDITHKLLMMSAVNN